jgi:pectate lyase
VNVGTTGAEFAREALPANDGWAATGGGVDGGAKSRPERKLTGPLEEARVRSAAAQAARVMVNLRSNTSLIGLGSTAKIVRGNLMVGAGVSNVIIRNIAFEDDFDYFPAWDPGDGFALNKDYPGCQEVFADASSGPQRCPGGRWNSEYDNISINGGTRVWIDRCLFSDGDRPDSTFPPVFPFPHNQVEQKVQHHDGLVDITNGADFVTLSHNVFKDHDKTSLIGGSDSLASDAGKLNARENHLAVLKLEPQHHTFRGALALGKDGSFCSENNVFEIQNGDARHAFIQQGGTRLTNVGSSVNGAPADLGAEPSPPAAADLGCESLRASQRRPRQAVKHTRQGRADPPVLKLRPCNTPPPKPKLA